METMPIADFSLAILILARGDIARTKILLLCLKKQESLQREGLRLKTSPSIVLLRSKTRRRRLKNGQDGPMRFMHF